MTLWSRLFHKSPPPAPTLEQRIEGLRVGTTDFILSTALSSKEEELRVAAIGRLPDGEALRRLAGASLSDEGGSAAVPEAVSKAARGAGPPALQRAAQARLAELVDSGSIDFAAFCAQTPNRAAMFAVAALCKSAGRLPQALALIEDSTQVAKLVVESPSSRLRQLAADSVTDPAQLRELLRQVRGKDKNVYKILKQKCDALNAEERRSADHASETDSVLASIERHSLRLHDSFYASVLEHLDSRWRALAPRPAVEVEQRAAQALERCREVIAEHLRQIARQADQQVAWEAERRAAREAKERAAHAAEESSAAQSDAETQLRQEAAAAREAEEALRAQKLAEEEQRFREIGGLIRKANGALSDGNTQRAAGLRRAIEEKLSTAPPLPAYFVRNLQQLDQKLNELKQWKDYAVAPKRIELIEEMEALIGSSEEPKVLADRIKSLQQEWRTISKGIVSETPADWERFHLASQAAYQPCREYFEAQANLRRENLDNRKALIERVAAFETTQNETPDWRLLARVLREAPQEWRRYFPVDREAGKTVQALFDESMERLQARLDGWHQRNVADKQSLINRARQALAQEDGREAIEMVKRLQILWKETGSAPREQDQSLWSEFREVCDAVFQKRQQANVEYLAALEASKLKAVGLCEAVEQGAAASGAQLSEAASRIPAWREEFDALEEMPRADARGLQARFEHALNALGARVAKQAQLDTQQAFTHVLEAARRLRAFEWSIVCDAATADRDVLREAAERFISGVPAWPKGALQAVNETLANAPSLSESGREDREKALRTLCVRCEIQSGAETPPEDQPLRRDYQVQRLMKGMGQGREPARADWDAIVLEWIRIGGVTPALYENLTARFLRARQWS